MDYKEMYHYWITDSYFDEETKKELQSIACDEQEIKERFHKGLEFGTGGLRGVIGAGTNRMNIYTVGKATQGLANYILKQEGDLKSKGVAIAYDSRNMSFEFAIAAAVVLNGNGIKTYLYRELRPTPQLSFTVRELNCCAGIVVTASHNPPEYNGYKVYWGDGGQVPYPRDEEIIMEVNAITDFKMIRTMDMVNAIQSGLYNMIGSDLDDKYIAKVKEQSLNKERIRDDFSIVYTPLNGAGNKPVRRVLEEVGFNNVYVVPEQELPDKNFTTVGYPNPEDPKAFTYALALAKEKNADIVIASDPDADRLGVAVKDKLGEYVLLTGNMVGVLLCEYVLSSLKEINALPKDAVVVKTIVTTEMVQAIADHYGVSLINVLTGFKYIGEKIKEFEETKGSFIFGFEESYGYLAGTYARDKDSVVAAMLVCELASIYKNKGMTLYEGLLSLYEKYGFYKEEVKSITLKGIEGMEKMGGIMAYLRDNPLKSICNIKTKSLKDYKIRKAKNFITGETETITLPQSDVLYYTLLDGSWFCIRPSGTEPKIKLYAGVKGKDQKEADNLCESLMNEMTEKINHI